MLDPGKLTLGKTCLPRLGAATRCRAIVVPPIDRVILPLSRRVNGPTGPIMGISRRIFINALITRTSNFMDTGVRSDISNAIGTVASGSVVVASSKGVAPSRDLRPFGMRAPRSLTGTTNVYNLIKLNNTNFPAGIGLALGPSAGVSALVVGTTRYRPCVADSCHRYVRGCSSILGTICLVGSVLNIRGTVVYIRTGGRTTVGGLCRITASIHSDRSGIGLVQLPSGCPRNTRGIVVCSTANGGIPTNGLPDSINYVMVGVADVTALCHFVGANVPLMDGQVAISNATIGRPGGVVMPVNAPVGRILGFVNIARCSRVVVNNPVVNISIASRSTPIRGHGGTVAIVTGTLPSIDTTYVHYNQYTGAYPVGLCPTGIRSTVGFRGFSTLGSLGVGCYVRYNYYSCIYPTGHPLARAVQLTGSVLEERDG